MATPPPRPGVLIVDDDRIVAESLVAFLRAEAVEARCVHTAADAVAALTNGAGQDIGIVLADLSLPAGSPTAPADGIGLIRELHRLRPEIAIIAVTGFATVPAAVEALRSGAVDLLTKPVIDDELDLALERAGQQHTLLAENVNLRRRVGKDAGGRGVVGRDPRMRRVFERVEAVAPSRTTVLMTGESGTGKSLIARAI
ncbi:MAG: response regulator, partial [Planctomycetota bacterium]